VLPSCIVINNVVMYCLVLYYLCLRSRIQLKLAINHLHWLRPGEVGIMPTVKMDNNVHALRKLCRDAGFEPCWRPGDDANHREYLSTIEMRSVLAAVATAAAGMERHGRVGLAVLAEGHAFWAGLPLGAEVTLPGYGQVGALSCVRLAGMALTVWTYGTVHGIPDGVTVRQASDLLPLVEATALMERGLRIQHLSDIVRFRGIAESGHGGWFVDVDTIWLRPCLRSRSGSGHVFASMRATPNQLPFPGTAWQRFWKLKYLRQPDEQIWLSVPFFFPPASAVLSAVLGVIDAKLATTELRKLPYLVFMTTVKDHLQAQVVRSTRGGKLQYRTIGIVLTLTTSTTTTTTAAVAVQ
jgi:hypothetical protein